MTGSRAVYVNTQLHLHDAEVTRARQRYQGEGFTRTCGRVGSTELRNDRELACPQLEDEPPKPSYIYTKATKDVKAVYAPDHHRGRWL